MRGQSEKHRTGYRKTAVLAMAAAFFLSMEGIAAENTAAPFTAVSGNTVMSSDTENTQDVEIAPVGETAEDAATSFASAEGDGRESSQNTVGDVLSVELPVVPEGETSPFDFFLDPAGLLYETDAMRYGGGTVEEGATVLFRNGEGKYTFSRYSDKLTVVNQGEAPALVTVSARVHDLDQVALVGREELSADGEPGLYLALVDDRGNEQPVSGDAEATIRMELASGEYSFGLTGACNPDADWRDMRLHPRVTVTWRVEPALTEGEEESMEETEGLTQEDGTGQDPVSEDLEKASEDETTTEEADGGAESGSPDEGSEDVGRPTGASGSQGQGSTGSVSANTIPESGKPARESGSDGTEKSVGDGNSRGGTGNGSSAQDQSEKGQEGSSGAERTEETPEAAEEQTSFDTDAEMNEEKGAGTESTEQSRGEKTE